MDPPGRPGGRPRGPRRILDHDAVGSQRTRRATREHLDPGRRAGAHGRVRRFRARGRRRRGQPSRVRPPARPDPVPELRADRAGGAAGRAARRGRPGLRAAGRRPTLERSGPDPRAAGSGSVRAAGPRRRLRVVRGREPGGGRHDRPRRPGRHAHPVRRRPPAGRARRGAGRGGLGCRRRGVRALPHQWRPARATPGAVHRPAPALRTRRRRVAGRRIPASPTSARPSSPPPRRRSAATPPARGSRCRTGVEGG